MIKQFKVLTVSKNTNSFGLFGMILMARDGEAWQVAANSLNVRKQHAIINVPLDEKVPDFTQLNFEIPERLDQAPQHIADQVWS